MKSTEKRIPAYRLMANQIKKYIEDGKYSVGDLLPPEGELEKIYNVSRTTVRRAISELAQEGLLRVQQGYGTEVLAQKPYRRFSDVTGLEEEVLCNLDDFKLYSMNIDEVPLSEKDAIDLELEPGSMAYRVQRITGFNDTPFQIMVNYIPKHLAPDFTRYSGEFITLYPLLQEEYGLEFTSAEEEITARVADFMEAQVLHIPVGAPLIHLSRVAKCNKGPLECSYITIRADLYKIRISMNTIHSKIKL